MIQNKKKGDIYLLYVYIVNIRILIQEYYNRGGARWWISNQQGGEAF